MRGFVAAAMMSPVGARSRSAPFGHRPPCSELRSHPLAVLPSLVEALKSGTDDEKLDGLGQLAQIMDTSYGEDAEALCEFLRVAGCVALIAGLLGHEKAEIHQTAMLCVRRGK